MKKARDQFFILLKRVFFLAIASLAMFASPVKSQPLKPTPSNPYILFTGLVLTSDSLKAIPYVVIKNSRLGMIGHTDKSGYFSVIVRKGDTIDFMQIEQKPSRHIVPDTLSTTRYHVVKLMVQDTLTLPAIFIRAMPLKTMFDHAFLTQNIPHDKYEIARQNLEQEELKDLLKLRPNDAAAAQSYLQQSRANQLYYYKQAPPQNIFSPMAWAEFINAWKRGDFKKKPAKKTNYSY